jgi:hypothetical protein
MKWDGYPNLTSGREVVALTEATAAIQSSTGAIVSIAASTNRRSARWATAWTISSDP